MKPHRIFNLHSSKLIALSVAILSLLVVLSVVGRVPSTAQSTKERELEDKIPKHLPLKIKIKKEKEFKDLKNEKWARDFELEVMNVGDKPIYYLSLLLLLPETKAPNGRQIVFPLRYGRSELVDFRTPLQPEDIPIGPGKSYVLKIPQRETKGWENFKSKEQKTDPKKIQLKFQLINFGDGTGYMRNDGVPIPNKQAAKCVPDESKEIKTTLRQIMLEQPLLPARFMPVNFSEQMISSTSQSMTSQSNICCPGHSVAFALSLLTLVNVVRLHSRCQLDVMTPLVHVL